MGKVYSARGVELIDTSGGTIIDGQGVVSTSQFTQSGGTNSADNQAITGTAVTPLTNGTLSIALNRNALVQYLFTVDAYMVNSSNGCHIFPTVAGTIPYAGAGKYFVVLAATNQTLRSYSSHHFETLPAGTTDVILSANLTDAGAGTCTVTRWRAEYIVFGK